MSTDHAPSFVPADYQPPLPVDRFVVTEPPDDEAVPLDVLFVGGGPAGLAGAIELAQLARADAEAGGLLASWRSACSRNRPTSESILCPARW